jgi:hypothetical protein
MEEIIGVKVSSRESSPAPVPVRKKTRHYTTECKREDFLNPGVSTFKIIESGVSPKNVSVPSISERQNFYEARNKIRSELKMKLKIGHIRQASSNIMSEDMRCTKFNTPSPCRMNPFMDELLKSRVEDSHMQPYQDMDDKFLQKYTVQHILGEVKLCIQSSYL